MPTWTVKIEREAEKVLEKLDAQLQKRIVSKLRRLESNPDGQGTIKLTVRQNGGYESVTTVSSTIFKIVSSLLKSSK